MKTTHMKAAGLLLARTSQAHGRNGDLQRAHLIFVVYLAAIVFAVCATTANAKHWPDPPGWWLNSSYMRCVRYVESKDGSDASRNIYEMQGPATRPCPPMATTSGCTARRARSRITSRGCSGNGRAAISRGGSMTAVAGGATTMVDVGVGAGGGAAPDDTPTIVVPITGQVLDLTRPRGRGRARRPAGSEAPVGRAPHAIGGRAAVGGAEARNDFRRCISGRWTRRS